MKKIVIIGAGVSGLVSGVYARKHDFDTLIIEAQPQVGGLCTSWFRKGFEIDGCIHWLVGTRSGTDLNNMWKEVGALEEDGSDILSMHSFGTYYCYGDSITLYNDAKKFKAELLRVAPEDKKLIDQLLKDMYCMANMPIPVEKPSDIWNFKDLFRFGFPVIPYLGRYLTLTKMNKMDYAKQFKSAKLRYLFSHLPPNLNSNAYAMIYTLANVIFKNSDIPAGGSRAFVGRILQKYKELGGDIKLNTRVKEILVNDKKRAYGVLLDSGKIIYAEYIVVACDPFVLFNDLLDPKYKDNVFEKCYKQQYLYDSPSGILISMRVNKELITKKMGISNINYFSCEPFKAGESTLSDIIFRNYAYDNHFVKNGQVLANVLIDQKNIDFPYWENLYLDQDAYKKEKNRLAREIVVRLAKQYNLKEEDFDILDVCTPYTFTRYVGAYKGSYMPFMITDKNKMLMHKGKIANINGLYLSGQWCQCPGGIPPALLAGRWTIQRICKREKIKSLFSKHFAFKFD